MGMAFNLPGITAPTTSSNPYSSMKLANQGGNWGPAPPPLPSTPVKTGATSGPAAPPNPTSITAGQLASGLKTGLAPVATPATPALTPPPAPKLADQGGNWGPAPPPLPATPVQTGATSGPPAPPNPTSITAQQFADALQHGLAPVDAHAGASQPVSGVTAPSTTTPTTTQPGTTTTPTTTQPQTFMDFLKQYYGADNPFAPRSLYGAGENQNDPIQATADYTKRQLGQSLSDLGSQYAGQGLGWSDSKHLAEGEATGNAYAQMARDLGQLSVQQDQADRNRALQAALGAYSVDSTQGNQVLQALDMLSRQGGGLLDFQNQEDMPPLLQLLSTVFGFSPTTSNQNIFGRTGA